MKFLETKIEGLALDMTTNSPVVILAPLGLDKVLPIWIGHAEAWAIAMELSGVKARRPMTYDLLVEMIDSLKAKISRVEITELKEQTFYAKIHMISNSKDIEVDARPSDSIAIALKSHSKIFVNEELFNLTPEETAKMPDVSNDPESLRERLKRIDPEDFGKYSL